jgi:hypothetical protein
MEHLLRLSGLLPEGDDDTVDLGDLERRLRESANSSQRAPSNIGRSSSESARGTPSSSALQSDSASPTVAREEVEVEALSDQMCSLVTNNCGETRFIGMFTRNPELLEYCRRNLMLHRLVIWVFNILTPGDPMGKREDWRH